ncbi:unnamed protein product [marine sediment metagenome]|uniref:Uncharacterized protein n=1 Tax=marine sediment metagenome TaxID=412755 RepID=X0WAE5_9ZZZZ
MPGDDTDLETDYSVQDYLDVNTKNDVRVEQTATDEYAIHQFKDYTELSTIGIEWEGQTNTAPASVTVYLQIYNRETTEWETVDSNGAAAADTDFILTANIADTADYIDAGKVVSCRVYQLAT